MNDETRWQAGPDDLTVAEEDTRAGRCPSCAGWVSRRCVICRGLPDAALSIERIARGAHQVDRATRLKADHRDLSGLLLGLANVGTST